jgi:hypothetical protein
MESEVKIDWAEEYSDWKYALNEASVGKVEAKDIAETLFASEGANDEANWLAIVRMADGRFAFISAGCDYTGWDCQASGEIAYADSLADLCRLNMDDQDRRRLGVDVFGEKVT